MKRRNLLSLPTLLCAGLPTALHAQAGAPVAWPEVVANLPEARWSGGARLRYLGFDVYDAQLWVAPGFRASQYGQHRLSLSLTYLRALRGRAIAERSLTEMHRQRPLTPDQNSRWLSAMQATFVDVAASDRLTGLHQPAQGATFWLNGRPLGSISDASFSQRFFGIWLEPGSSEPGLRRSLLAGAAA